MADVAFDDQRATGLALFVDIHVDDYPNFTDQKAIASGVTGPINYFKMRGMDHNTNGLYDTWVVTGAADPTGASYFGGLAVPLRDIVIDASWSI